MPLRTSLPLILAACLVAIGIRLASGAIININPSKDNTLYEYVPADGDLSNALGFHFLAGETAMSELRRGVLGFDMAGNSPARPAITRGTLSCHMSRTGWPTSRVGGVHRLLGGWGRGTSE